MLYHTHPEDPRIFFYHSPTSTLAELKLNAGPNGDHLLCVAADSPPPDQAFSAMEDYLRSIDPNAAAGLILFTRASLSENLPEHIILIGRDHSALIHYPAIGFTAGIAANGSNIPPSWKNPEILTPAQRSHFLDQAAQNLLRSPIFKHLKRQAT